MTAPGVPHVLVLYDLNGFKRFNDLFGHPAGDALLARLAAKLADVVGAAGTCYRLGGDEFCVLARRAGRRAARRSLDATAVALSESGRASRSTTALGCVFLPRRRPNRIARCSIADQRLYARKHSQPDRAGSAARRPAAGALRARARPAPPRQQRRRAQPRPRPAARARRRRRWRRSSPPPSCTTSASSPSPTRSSTSRARSTRRSARSSGSHTIIGERILSAAPALGQSARSCVRRTSAGRQRLSGWPRRRRYPACGADHRRLRHLFGDHLDRPVPGRAEPRRRPCRAPCGCGQPARPRPRRALLYDRLARDRGGAARDPRVPEPRLLGVPAPRASRVAAPSSGVAVVPACGVWRHTL